MPEAVTASVTRLPGGGDLPIEPADIGQQFESEAFTFDRGDAVGADAAEQLGGPIGAEPLVLHQR